MIAGDGEDLTRIREQSAQFAMRVGSPEWVAGIRRSLDSSPDRWAREVLRAIGFPADPRRVRVTRRDDPLLAKLLAMEEPLAPAGYGVTVRHSGADRHAVAVRAIVPMWPSRSPRRPADDVRLFAVVPFVRGDRP